MLLGGCSGDEPVAAPSPTASPSPSPSPTMTVLPVAGAREVTVTSVSSNSILGIASDPEPDTAALTDFAEAIATWLDRHLDDLQRGGVGALDDVAEENLLAGADPALLDRLTSQLTNPDAPVADARYDIRVSHSGAPIHARADVIVSRQTGDARQAAFVFVPDENGVRLVMVGEVAG